MEKIDKIVWILVCLQSLMATFVVAQETAPEPKSELAENFRITVEPAWVKAGQPNTVRENELEKKLFPGRNGLVEFFFDDSPHCSQGFRIDAADTNNFVIEVAWVTVFEEEYTIEKRAIPVGADLAGVLWETYYRAMRYYVSRGIPPIYSDGYSATFRCLVDNYSVWTFSTKKPVTHFKNLARTCNEIVKDIQENGKITDEEKYTKQIRDICKEAFSNKQNTKIPGFLDLDDLDSKTELIRFGY